MPCFSPMTAYRSRNGEVTFNRNLSVTGIGFKLPCGQCVGCRLERSRQWAMRCMHEAKDHEDNCVVTLTYDNEHLPADRSLCKRDLQLFMKRLRKKLGKVRFYACGEYGENNKRPHYHAVLFGLDFSDKRFYKKSKVGDNLYKSAELNEIWQNGDCTIGEVTFESCAYIARYIVDKMTGELADEWYTYVNPTTGEVVRVVAEFTNMSRKPGIGASYFDKWSGEVYAHDSIIMNGVEVRPPRFYDTRMEAIDPKRMEVIKAKRRREAMKHQEDNTPERRRVKERVQVLTLNMWKRDVT